MHKARKSRNDREANRLWLKAGRQLRRDDGSPVNSCA